MDTIDASTSTEPEPEANSYPGLRRPPGPIRNDTVVASRVENGVGYGVYAWSRSFPENDMRDRIGAEQRDGGSELIPDNVEEDHRSWSSTSSSKRKRLSGMFSDSSANDLILLGESANNSTEWLVSTATSTKSNASSVESVPSSHVDDSLEGVSRMQVAAGVGMTTGTPRRALDTSSLAGSMLAERGMGSCDMGDWEKLKVIWMEAMNGENNPTQVLSLLRGIIHECERIMHIYLDPSILYTPSFPSPVPASTPTLFPPKSKSAKASMHPSLPIVDAPGAFHALLASSLTSFSRIISLHPDLTFQGEPSYASPYLRAALAAYEMGDAVNHAAAGSMGLGSDLMLGKGRANTEEDWKFTFEWAHAIVALASTILIDIDSNPSSNSKSQSPPCDSGSTSTSTSTRGPSPTVTSAPSLSPSATEVPTSTDPFFPFTAEFRPPSVFSISGKRKLFKWPPTSPLSLLTPALPDNLSVDELLGIATDHFTRAMLHVPRAPLTPRNFLSTSSTQSTSTAAQPKHGTHEGQEPMQAPKPLGFGAMTRGKSFFSELNTPTPSRLWTPIGLKNSYFAIHRPSIEDKIDEETEGISSRSGSVNSGVEEIAKRHAEVLFEAARVVLDLAERMPSSFLPSSSSTTHSASGGGSKGRGKWAKWADETLAQVLPAIAAQDGGIKRERGRALWVVGCELLAEFEVEEGSDEERKERRQDARMALEKAKGWLTKALDSPAPVLASASVAVDKHKEVEGEGDEEENVVEVWSWGTTEILRDVEGKLARLDLESTSAVVGGGEELVSLARVGNGTKGD